MLSLKGTQQQAALDTGSLMSRDQKSLQYLMITHYYNAHLLSNSYKQHWHSVLDSFFVLAVTPWTTGAHIQKK